jgi:putative hydrolase of the HAD superfamily
MMDAGEPIRAVTFDFWRTLYQDPPEVHRERVRLRVRYAVDFLRSQGANVTDSGVELALELLSRHVQDLSAHHNTGVSAEELGRTLARTVNAPLDLADAERLGELISWAGREEPPRPLPRAVEAVSAVAKALPVGLICDTGLTLGRDLYAVLEADGLAGLFAHFTFSDQTGTTKPMTRQFHHTLLRLGVRPAEAVHVGDTEGKDVAGAHLAGMRAIRIVAECDDAATQAEASVTEIGESLDILREWGVEV